jgi:hypothetical protein
MESLNQYLDYVKGQLNTLDQSKAKASYDTGFGIHITSEYLGTEVHCMDVMATSLIKIRPPNIDNFDQWELAWNSARALINGFTKS